MKQNKKYYSISLLFILLILSIISIPINVKGVEPDLDYTFERDILYEGFDPSIDGTNSFNLRNKTEYSGHYNATYSFENEIGLEGTEIEWINISNSEITIIENDYLEHDAVLYFKETTAGTQLRSYWNFPQKTGIVEYWINNADNLDWSTHLTDDAQIHFTHVAFTTLTNIRFSFGDGIGGSTHINTAILENSWNHIKVQFDCNTNKWSGWLNNELKVDNENFLGDGTPTDLTRFRVYDNSFSEGYIDAIGYSWDNFTTGFSFDISGECSEPTGICWDGTSFWVLDATDVYKYNSLGVYQTETHDISGQVSEGYGITWDGTYFWVVGYDNQEVYKYNSAWVYQTEFIDCSGQDSEILGITYDDTYLWITGIDTESVYKYDTSGVYQNEYFSTSNESQPADITWDGTYFWISGGTPLSIYQYNSSGNYTDISFDVAYLDAYGVWIDSDGTFLWYVGSDNLEVYQLFYKESLEYYYIGKNLLPLIISDTSIKQVDKYEFAWLAQNQLFAIGWQTIESWVVDETGGGTVEIFYDYPNVYTDRTVELDATDSNNALFQKLDIHTPTSNFINITYGFNITSYSANGNNFVFQVMSSATAFIEVKIRKPAGIIEAYYNVDGVGNVLLYSGLNIDDYYEINVLINHELKKVSYLLYENGVFIAYHQNKIFKETSYPYVVSGIKFVVIAPAGGNLNIQLDYCGIYNGGLSHVQIPESYGYFLVPLLSNWNIQHNNLLKINATGQIALDTFSGYTNTTPYRTGINYSVVSTFKTYDGSERLTNTYDRTSTYGFTTLVFFFSGNISIFDYISVEGVKLTEGSNEYFLEYTHGVQTPVDYNYFYVDSSNRLRFVLKPTIDDSLEYIQATFDISDVSSDNRAIAFHSDIDDYAIGEFRVNFTTFINALLLPVYPATTRAIITQNRTISYFTLLISDYNINALSGTTTLGYLSHIQLIYTTNIDVSIITLTLIGIIIPLIIIMIPTLGISQRAGKNLITPMFLLMSIICVATSIIPVWLFFIIAISCSLFIFLKKGVI